LDQFSEAAQDKLLVLFYNLKLVHKKSLFVLKRPFGADRGTSFDFACLPDRQAQDKLLVPFYNLKLVHKKASSF
jgi:hypothetical protein